MSGTLIRKINYLHPASLLFFDSVRSVGLKQGFLFKGEQVGFLRVGRAAVRPGRPLAAVGGQGKRGRSGRRPGAADRSEAKRDCEAAGRGAAGQRAGDLQLLLGGGHFFGGPILLREGRRGGRGGVSGNHTRPGPARCACKAASTAPPDHGAGRCGRTRRSRSTLRDSAPLFPRVTLSWRPWRWAGQGRPSSPEGPSIPGDSERTRTWAASGHYTLADLAPFP